MTLGSFVVWLAQAYQLEELVHNLVIRDDDEEVKMRGFNPTDLL